MLEEYRRKRDFKLTPEPPAHQAEGSGALKFVIQKHSARRLHYDFRLEVDGVLVSWAVPKGPSFNPADKRLAVQTEDHPMDYAAFEGIIPKGEYGGGPVIIWDQGTYSPDEDGKLYFDDPQNAEKIIKSGLKKGKISFTLRGNKLHGSWTLFKLKNTQKDWILLKHKDAAASTTIDIVEQEDRSVVSGRTIEELREGKAAAQPLLAIKDLPGAKTAKFPTEYEPMLASLADEPFSREGWIYEPKVDGIRVIALLNGRKIKLLSRRGIDITGQYPALVSELSAYASRKIVLDGEIVALDDRGRPSFQELQQRSGLTRGADIKLADEKRPAYFYVFDMLYVDGKSLEKVMLADRKAALKQTIAATERIRIIDALAEDGFVAYQACIENGLEGVVAKRADSLYEPGRRSKNWLKIKGTLTSEFLICGYTEGTGARHHTFGSLIVGYYDKNGKLAYAGGVGTGFNDKLLRELQSRMEPLETDSCPFPKKPPGKKIQWIKPKLIAEIKFAEWTRDGILRSPVFLRLREDIKAKEVTRTQVVDADTTEAVDMEAKKKTARASTTAKKTKSAEAKKTTPKQRVDVIDMERHRIRRSAGPLDKLSKEAIEQLSGTEKTLVVELDGHKISFSNLDKVFWPAHDNVPAYTKRDYAIYLAKVAPYLIPHTKDRPITLLRYPNGIKGPKFYQKHWEHKLPEFVSTVMLYGENAGADQEYMTCDNLPTLLWLAQIADIELHTWQARVNPEPDGQHLSRETTGSLEQLEKSILNYPDFLLFDLDPYIYSGKEKQGDEPELNQIAFQKTCDLARWIKEILDPLKIKAYLKTTGRTGLHMYIPVVRNLTFEETRAISEAIGKLVLGQHPNDVTMDWAVVKRTGKIFLDHNMNSRGKTLASIYSPRVSAQASVSIPVRWEELDKIYPTDFTMNTVIERLDKVGDLWSDILENKNDLSALMTQAAQYKRSRRRSS
jgi:bifunctional non-homologous end joining protein LigD